MVVVVVVDDVVLVVVGGTVVVVAGGRTVVAGADPTWAATVGAASPPLGSNVTHMPNASTPSATPVRAPR